MNFELLLFILLASIGSSGNTHVCRYIFEGSIQQEAIYISMIVSLVILGVFNWSK